MGFKYLQTDDRDDYFESIGKKERTMAQAPATKDANQGKTNVPAEQKPAGVPAATAFENAVLKEMTRFDEGVAMTAAQKRLAQHLFVRVDMALKEAEAKRKQDNPTPYIWVNVNMQKLALDALHRIELGLDALIPNHIWPIAYYNGHNKNYDMDLRIGYAGKDYYRRAMALEEPKDIIYELVYENDTFKPIKRSLENGAENYVFDIPKPFDRGKVIGGFGYIVFEDSRKNKLVLVDQKEFDRAKAKAGNDKFWGPWEDRMQLKTVVHRTVGKLPVDPRKVTDAFMAVEAQDDATDRVEAEREIATLGNTGAVIDITDGAKALPENGAQAEAQPETKQPEPEKTGKPEQEKPQEKKTARQPGW